MSEIKICSDASGCFLGGLSATQTILSEKQMRACAFVKDSGTSTQFLKADGSVDSTTYTTCLGDITGVTTNAGISGGGASGTVTIGIDAATAANFDQSGCAGILCVGTVTPSTTDTFTNKSGNISQWTNNSGYTTCLGTVCEVTTGIYLTGGVTDGGATGEIGIDSACTSKWDTAAIGDISAVTATGALSGGGTSGDVCIGLDASSAANFDQSGCAGIDCVGVYTSIGVSDGLETTGGTSPTLGIATACNTKWDQSGCAGLACVGDITGVTTNAGISGGGASGSVTIGIDATTAAGFDQSGCAGINCVGDITGVTDTAGLSTSGTSGNICIGLDATTAASLDQSGCAGIDCVGDVTGIDAGTAITVTDGTTSTPQVAVNSTCNSTWNAKTTCTGTVTTAGTLLSGSSTTIGVDSGALDYLNQSGCAGINCVGDITGVTDTAGLSTAGSSGNICIGIDAGFDQSGCAGINCVGVYTSIGVSDGLESTGGTTPTLGIATACNTKWDQSGCADVLVLTVLVQQPQVMYKPLQTSLVVTHNGQTMKAIQHVQGILQMLRLVLYSQVAVLVVALL
jgi:hypothetical protein